MITIVVFLLQTALEDCVTTFDFQVTVAFQMSNAIPMFVKEEFVLESENRFHVIPTKLIVLLDSFATDKEFANNRYYQTNLVMEMLEDALSVELEIMPYLLALEDTVAT